jgi:dynein heavy chain 1, cytosolic
MTVAQEELQDLKGVWAELSKIWQQIDELKERPWISVQPRKVSVCFSKALSMSRSCKWVTRQIVL